MENWKKKTAELILKLLIGEDKNPAVTPYEPQKTKALGKDKSKYFKRARPEKCRISSARLYSMLAELEKSKSANVHNLLVLCRGRVICEASHPGYSTTMPHLSHSLSKTVTGIAIGMLIDEGKLALDDKVASFFPEYTYADKRFAKMTVEHLLRMSSGVSFAELGCATSDDWIESFFESELKYTPGTGFSYNSMNSYLLAVIAERQSGVPFDEFVRARLFEPLKITNFLWEKNRRGTAKGGWGLYLSPESWAKIGFMVMRGGIFEGRRLVSPQWLSEAFISQSEADGAIGDFNYGYHVWVSSDNSEFLFNGMFGQNVWICPKNDIVVVMNSGNNELFQRSNALSIIRKYLGPDIDDKGYANFYMALLDKCKTFFVSRHWIRRKQKPGILCRLGLWRDRMAAEEWRMLEGEYKLADNNASVLPLFVRLMQNNLSGSMDSVRFHVDVVGSLTVTFVISEKEYVIPVGIHNFITTEHDFNGEKYLISAIGEAIEDEDRNPIFKLELLMPEMPNTRKIKITKAENGNILLRLSENPDRRIADSYLGSALSSTPLISMAMGMLKKRLGADFLQEGMDLLFSPSVVGVKTDNPSFNELYYEENLRAVSSREKYKSVSALIGGFLGDDEKEEDARRSPLAAIGDFLRRRRGAPERDDAAASEGALQDSPEDVCRVDIKAATEASDMIIISDFIDKASPDENA